MAGKREFTRTRRTLAKELDRAVREESRVRRWKSAMGNAFAEREGWFVIAVPSVSFTAEATRLQVLGKPITVDPKMWEMAGYPELTRQPLSYRYNGVLACMPIRLAQADLDETSGASGLACQALDAAEAAVEGIRAQSLDMAGYIERLDRDGFGLNLNATKAAALLLADREREARDLLAVPQVGGVQARSLRAGLHF